MTRTWFEVRLGRVHRRSSSHRGRGRPDRCIHGVLGSRRGDRQVLFVVGAVGTQSAGWVGSTHLVLMGTALCGLALWVVCWSVSAGVRCRSGNDAMAQRREVTRHPASRMDTRSQGGPYVRSVTGWN